VGGLTHAFSSVGGYGAGVHLLVSAAAAPVLFLALIRLHLVPDLSRRRQLHQRLGIGLIGFSAGFSAGIPARAVRVRREPRAGRRIRG
jgi:hypothetical protein